MRTRLPSPTFFSIAMMTGALIASFGCARAAAPSNDTRVLQNESGSADGDVALPAGALFMPEKMTKVLPMLKSFLKAPLLAAPPVKPSQDAAVYKPMTEAALHGFEKIRVKLFPIESNHQFDPYLNSVGTRLVKLQNPGGLLVKGLAHVGTLKGEAVSFDFKSQIVQIDEKAYVLNSEDEISLAPVSARVPTSLLLRVDINRLRRAGVIGKDGRLAFSGTFVVAQGRRDRWTVINETSLEDYVTSVVPSEMPLSYSDRALKVQALAARTFAVRSMMVARCVGRTRCASRDWDVDPSVSYQSFTGVLSERSRVREIVDSTRGAVITYRHTPILAMFHASSGGRTKSADQYFCTSRGKSAKERERCRATNATEYPYLKAVVDSFNDGEDRLGHGVGLSQHSVEIMSQKNQSITSIVSLFYPGTIIENLPPQ